MRRCLILCLFTFIGSLVCWADAGKDAYLFRKVDYQQGLSNSAVLCLYQDKAGLMWFGTYDGVNCYDGKGIEVFRSDFSIFSRQIAVVCGLLHIWELIVFRKIRVR